MHARNAVKEMVEASGKTTSAVSKAMGSDSYVAMTISRGSVPKLDTFVKIAQAAGFEVVLRGNGKELTIEP